MKYATKQGRSLVCWLTLQANISAQWLTDDLRQRVALQVQKHRSRLQTRPELKQTVQRQRGHVRFTPSLSSLLHLLFKLHPPEGKTERGTGQDYTTRGMFLSLELGWWDTRLVDVGGLS